MSARTLLARVRRLEAARAPGSPFVREYGSFEAFVAWAEAKVLSGDFGPEVRVVVQCFARWERDGVWEQALERRP